MDSKDLNSNEINFVRTIEADLVSRVKHNKRSVEKLAVGYGIKNQNLVKEFTELAIVNVARLYSQSPNNSVFEKYNKIVELYNHQVNLSHRTSKSMLLQQYSTPAPIAYIAGIYAGLPGAGKIFEPSAGNGLLTIAAKTRNCWVNEVDTTRLINLRSQNYAGVTELDASRPFPESFHKAFDAVITNPPFGSLEKPVYFDKFPISTLDHLMAVYALQCMKNDGKAAIIIGSHTQWDAQGRIKAGKNRIFFSWLYKHYQVDDVINIDGHKLYSRQGTAFDVRLILISGRKLKPGGYAPLNKKTPQSGESWEGIIYSFEDLYKRVMLFTDLSKNQNQGPKPETQNPKEYHRVFIVHKDDSPVTEIENLNEEEANIKYHEYLKDPNSEIVTWDKDVYNKYGKFDRKTIKMKVLEAREPKDSYKYPVGYPVSFIGTGNKVYTGKITDLNKIAEYIVSYGKHSSIKPENELTPAIVSTKKVAESGGGYKAFKSLHIKPGFYYLVKFFDDKIYKAAADEKNKAQIEAIRWYLSTNLQSNKNTEQFSETIKKEIEYFKKQKS